MSNFKPKWYKQDFEDIPTFQQLEDITGTNFDSDGFYTGPKERPEMQLVVDKSTNRKYWARKEYDEDLVKYGIAALEKEFNSKEWWGMQHDPHLPTGEKILAAAQYGFAKAGEVIANTPTKIVSTIASLHDAIGLDAGNIVKTLAKTNPYWIAQSVYTKGKDATIEDWVKTFKSIKTPKGVEGETARLYRASAKNWEETINKYLPTELEDNIKANYTLFTASEIVGQVGASLGLAAVGNAAGGMATIASLFGSQQFYEVREELLANGNSLDQANLGALLAGIAEGGLEALGFDKWYKFAKYNKSIKNIMLAGLVEGAQEGSQQLSEETITRMFGARDSSIEGLKEAFVQIAFSAFIGGLTGGAISLAVGGNNVRFEKFENQTRGSKEAIQESKKRFSTTKEAIASAKANKGTNPAYDTVRDFCTDNGITDENTIDAMYIKFVEAAESGATQEALFQGLSNQIVAYKALLENTPKDLDKENKQAAEDIKFHLSQEAVDQFRNKVQKAAEESGMDKEKAKIVADSEAEIYSNLSNSFGEDVLGVKGVEISHVPSRVETKTKESLESVKEAEQLNNQITEAEKVGVDTTNLQQQRDQAIQNGITRGYIEIGKTLNKIVLGEHSDVTTIKHELMHHWCNIVDLMAAKGNKKAKSLKIVKDSIIAKQSQYTNADRNKEMEVITEAYEKWLYMGGIGFTEQEKSLFGAMRDYFKQVYKSAKQITGVHIDPMVDDFFKQLTGLKPVSQLSDRFLGNENTITEEDVKQLNQDMVRSIDNLVEKMSPEEKTKTIIDLSDRLELNAESFKDKNQRDYMRKVAKEKYEMSDKEVDDLFSFADQFLKSVMGMALKKGHKRFTSWNETKADTYLDKITKFMMPVVNAFKTNGDYEWNFDLGTLCIKREAMDALIRHLLTKGYAQQLGPTQMDALKEILREYGFETACDVCFVEGKRLRQLIFANSFAYEWESVKLALGIKDKAFVGEKERKLTDKQKEILDEMTDNDLYEKAFEKYIAEDRRRTYVGKTPLDSGITANKMRMIANLFKEDNNLAASFKPEWLLSTAGVDWLMRTYGGNKTNIRNVLNGMYGSATPKPIEGFGIYTPTSFAIDFDKKKKDNLIEELFRIGGARAQSFSDFNAMLSWDYFQMFMDATLRQLPMHIYTKVPALIELYGKVGAHFNMSLVPQIEETADETNAGLKKATQEQIDAYNKSKKKGTLEKDIIDHKIENVYTDEKGVSWVYSWSNDSFPVDKAYELRKKSDFKGRVGIIAVGVSDKHIKMMLADPAIDMVIPFHRSGMPKHTSMVTGLERAKDYTPIQNTKKPDDFKEDFYYNENLSKESKDPRKAANAYLKWCEKNGLTPKFKPFTNDKNYYKLLEDFRGYDNDGKAVIQGAVNIRNLQEKEFVGNLDSALEDRESVVQSIEGMNKNKEMSEKIKKVLSKQRIDGSTREALERQLKKAIGVRNVKILTQDKFLAELQNNLAKEIGEENASKRVEVFRQKEGFVYGFAKGNKIVLNENQFNAETPAHEFTHVWSKVARFKNKKLWDEGKALLKETSVWKEVMSDSLYSNIREDEDAVASEVLARIVGLENSKLVAKVIDPAHKESKVTEGAIAKVLDWFKKMWNEVRDIFSFKEDGKPLTYDEFIHMPLKDLWDETRSKNFYQNLRSMMLATKKAKTPINSELMADGQVFNQSIPADIKKKYLEKAREIDSTDYEVDLNMPERDFIKMRDGHGIDKDEYINDIVNVLDDAYDRGIKTKSVEDAKKIIQGIFYGDNFEESFEGFVESKDEFEGMSIEEVAASDLFWEKVPRMISDYKGDLSADPDVIEYAKQKQSEHYRNYMRAVEDRINTVDDLFKNLGFITKRKSSRKSVSEYVEVYENEESEDPFYKVRVSDHDDVSRFKPAGRDTDITIYLNRSFEEQIKEIIKEIEKPNILEQRGFHGTPARGIVEFDNEFVGTGTGLQAHGWGLYFTTDREAAESYKGNDNGQLYEVDIPEDDVMLNEDYYFDDQPKKVQEVLESIGKNLTDEQIENLGYDSSKPSERAKAKQIFDYDMYEWTGGKIYQTIADMEGGQKEASQLLDLYGIKGIKYFGKQDEKCYVVFDGKPIEIIQTYYQLKKAGKTASKAADKRPSDERIDKDLAAIERGNFGTFRKKESFWSSVGEGFANALLSVRQRAGAISPKMKAFFDKLDFWEVTYEQKYSKPTIDWLRKYTKLDDVTKSKIDYLINNRCDDRLEKYLIELGMLKEFKKVRNMLDDLYRDGNLHGIDMNFMHEYYPTRITDYEGFVTYLIGTDKWTYIAKALKEIDPESKMTNEEKAAFINKLVRGEGYDLTKKPAAAKAREILYKDPNIMKFYAPADEALINYVKGMSKAIATYRAFGKGKDVSQEETIGGIIKDLIDNKIITPREEKVIRHLLKSRLTYQPTPYWVRFFKNTGYLTAMNNITSAVTQLGDLYAGFYKYGFATQMETLFGKKEITTEDLGLDKIMEEFVDAKGMAFAVDKLFKVVGLNWFDKMGKTVAINGSLRNLRKQASKGDFYLMARLAATFGKDAGNVLSDIKAGKITDEIKILVMADLADTQPIGQSGVPTGYLNNPTMRLFYQLKTFTLGQVSLFYADSIVKAQKGMATRNLKMFLEGVGNGFKLLLLLTAFNAGADVLKNLIMGRKIDLSDTLVSNILWNFGVSKYTFYKGKRDGWLSSLFYNYLGFPLISTGDDIVRDLIRMGSGKQDVKDTKIVQYIPFGRSYYWWFGGGRTEENKKKGAR